MDPVLIRAYHDLIALLQYALANPGVVVRSLLPYAAVLVGVAIFLWLAENMINTLTIPTIKVSTTAGEGRQMAQRCRVSTCRGSGSDA